MGNYILRRMAMLIPTLVGMSILIFLMLRLLPGDIVDIMMGTDAQAGAEAEERLRDSFGLNDPIPIQYLNWIGNMFQGDFGESMRTGRPVVDILLSALPITVELAFLAVVIATIVAIPLGVISAIKRDTALDFGARISGLVGLSVPNFWLATLMLLATSTLIGWTPSLSYISPLEDPVGNLRQFLLPALALSVQLMAIEMRMTRTAMLEVLGQDYIRTARAKGLAERLVVYRHALRNSLIPVITVIGFQLGSLMGTAAIVEVIFGFNGVGNTLLQAIFNRDYPVVQASVLYLAVAFVLINLLVDILYVFIDPRIKQS
ncbi:MAG: ABC transporter permease [Chloroflexota bacterium]